MARHIYNKFSNKIGDTTYVDEAIECPLCGDVWDDESEIAEKLSFFGEDGQKAEYTCRQCGAKLRVTTMVALWRYMTQAVNQSAPQEPVAP